MKVYVLDKTGTRIWESNLGKAISNVHSSDLNEWIWEIVAGFLQHTSLTKHMGNIPFRWIGHLLWQSMKII